MTETVESALRHRLWLAVGWLVVGIVVWGCLTPSPPDLQFGLGLPQFDKLEHFGAYLLMMSWFAAALPGRRWWLSLIIAFVLMGGVIELVQGQVGRDAEWTDWFADIAGVTCGAWWPARWLARLHMHITHVHGAA